MKNNIKKYKSYIIIAVIVLLIIAVGFTAAYFQAQVGSGASANVTVTTKTTDVLTFSKGNDISITATQANFGSGAGNRTGSTTATASLRANNDTNSATQTYNVYLNVTGNNFEYTTSPTNTPELLLTVTNPSNQAVTSISGLTYTTVNGVSGFDITTKRGLFQIASNYSITSNSGTTTTNQIWNITVTLINLNSDQEANTNKTFTAQALIQKDSIPYDMELAYSNYVFSWNNVEDAVSYNVYANDNLVTNISTTSIELYKYLMNAGTYSVQIGALDSSNNEVYSNIYEPYSVSQVSPTTKQNVSDLGGFSCPEYSSYTLPDFDYINVLNFNSITTHYQTRAQSDCNENPRCNQWASWLHYPIDFYGNNVLNNFCSINSGLCDNYNNITNSSLTVSIFYTDAFGFNIQNFTNTIRINSSEHRLYYIDWGPGKELYIQFGKIGYVPSEWVMFSPNWSCVDENTLVYVYDNKKRKFKKKKIKNVKYNDKLLVWDFDNGCFAMANPLWIKQRETTYQYNLLKFSDGSSLKTVNHHRIFNVEKGRFTYPMTDDTPIGTTTFNSKGEFVTLISTEVVYKKINFCNIITNYHMNLFTNNILTSCRLNNIYKIKEMKFIKDNRELKPFDDYKGIDKKWYDGLRLSEYDGNINKNGSYREDIKDYIERIERIAQK